MAIQVLHINTNYIFSQLHQALVEHLENTHIRNSVFVPAYDKNKSIVVPYDNVIVSECFRKWDRIVFGYKQNKIFKSITKAYKLESFDLVHAHTLFTDGNCARTISMKYGIPYIVAIRDTDVNIFFKKAFWLRRRGIQIMKDASAIIFLSPAYRKEVFSKYVPKELISDLERKTYIIPNGIDDYWLKSVNLNKDICSVEKRVNAREIRLLFVGDISKRKNVSLTIKAVKLLQARGYDVRFCIVGEISDNSIFERLIKESFVKYVEPQGQESLTGIYRENDIFVMPSHTETFGLVYAEAMSQGLPVIYTRGQGFDGQFEEGTVGFATSDTDEKELAQRIVNVAEQYGRLSENCLHLCGKFDWGQIALHYKNIYNRVTSGMEGKG